MMESSMGTNNTTTVQSVVCDPSLSQSCGAEATCQLDKKTNEYRCVCPNDFRPPSPDSKCSKIIFHLPTNNKNDTSSGIPCDPDVPTSCGKKASCKLDEKSREYQCICPDLSIPSSDLKCPQYQGVRCDPNIKRSCGREAACVQIGKTKEHHCICPQDSSKALPNLKCNLKLNTHVDNPGFGRHKFPVVVPATSISIVESTTLSETFRSNVTSKSQIHFRNSWQINVVDNKIVIAFVGGLVLSLLLIILIWKFLPHVSLRKRNKTHKDKAFVIPLRKNILLEERYTTNPHYTAAGNTTDVCLPMVPIISRSAITDLQKIGEGFFGKVYKGQLHKTDKNGAERVEMVAVKVLKQSTNLEAEEDFMREVEIMSSFDHPNILTLIGLCPRENVSTPWMVFEFMPLGDLGSVLRKSGLQFWTSVPTLPALSTESLLSIASQISEGMEYLARQRFVHRDLACRNCLVGSDLSDLVVKISDFGMSRDVYTCDYYKIGGTRMLPIRWMAPESIVYGRFTLESDIWSYGVVLWEIYSYGKQPYYGYSNEEVLKLILEDVLLTIPDDCPEEIADIMKACWRKDIKERIVFSDICIRLSKMRESMGQQNKQSLPRPPPLPVSIDHLALMEDKAEDTDDEGTEDLLDEDNYLRPKSRSQSIISSEYIETIEV